MTYVNTKTLNLQYGSGTSTPAYISGAICNEHFTSGKHIFACMWPRTSKYIRGAHMVIGKLRNLLEEVHLSGRSS